MLSKYNLHVREMLSGMVVDVDKDDVAESL